MARISATSSGGEAGDEFASITRRVPSTSRNQKSSVRPLRAVLAEALIRTIFRPWVNRADRKQLRNLVHLAEERSAG
jgi:hypothetical protein